MFSSDLKVVADIGFPLTAKRIQEALNHAFNADNIIEWAFDNGYKLSKNIPSDDLTDEANKEHTYTVERQVAPYCDRNGIRMWNAPTAKEAITKAVEALKMSVEKDGYRKDDDYKQYPIVSPPWIKVKS